VGRPLAWFFAAWLTGRIATMTSALLGPWFTALVDLSFLVVLTSVAAREIVSAGNWRNMKVLLALALPPRSLDRALARADRGGIGVRTGHDHDGLDADLAGGRRHLAGGG
jgi:hypothetical protein